MKKSNMLTMAALTCGFAMMFTSCSKEDNGTQPALTVISFEHQTLNADGYWCGNETGTPFDNWGSTAYNCLYTEAEATFPVNYTPAWGSWSGYAISNINDTTFESYNVGQFKNVTGSAHSGKNFCVVYSFGVTRPRPFAASTSPTMPILLMPFSMATDLHPANLSLPTG